MGDRLQSACTVMAPQDSTQAVVSCSSGPSPHPDNINKVRNVFHSTAGVFAVMTFFQSIMWMNITANSLVQLCVILGVIYGVKPALLGATVLAYGEQTQQLVALGCSHG